jgi:hypothetical protein
MIAALRRLWSRLVALFRRGTPVRYQPDRFEVRRLHGDAVEVLYDGALGAQARTAYEAAKHAPVRGTIEVLHNGDLRAYWPR